MPPQSEKDVSATGIVLVDYDNIKPIAKETRTDDVTDNLVQIREWVGEAVRRVPVKVEEVSLRLYGGWTDESGSLTRRGNWVLSSMRHARGLANGIRFMPGIALSMADNALRLKGLYRVNRTVREQKMVDTLITVDALYFADTEHNLLAIASDDDDLVPALLGASQKRCKACCLFRIRDKGVGMNDGTLADRGIHIVKLGA